MVAATKKHNARLNLDMTRVTRDRLERLLDLTGAANRAEVIRRALELFEFVSTEEGAEISVRHGSKTTLLRLL